MKKLILLLIFILIPSISLASRDFNGSGDDVTIANFLDPDNGGQSYCVWTKADVLTNSVDYVILSQKDGTGTGRTAMWCEDIGDFDPHQYRSFMSGNTTSNGACDNTTDWIYVCFKMSSGAGSVNFAIQQIIGTTITSGGSIRNPEAADGDHVLGEDNVGADTWNGKLAFSSFYETELTDIEVIESSLKPESIVDSLTALLPLWGTESPEIDIRGDGHTGTVTGAFSSNDGPPVMFGGGLPL